MPALPRRDGRVGRNEAESPHANGAGVDVQTARDGFRWPPSESGKLIDARALRPPELPGTVSAPGAGAGGRGDEVVALSIEAQKPPPGVRVFRYRPRRGSSTDIHAWVADVETKVIRGEAAARAALELRDNGFAPDVICAHPGWGEALFLKDVFPKTRMLSFVEFYYRAEGTDFGFDPEFAEDDVAARCRLRMKNANSLLNLDATDWCVTPTEWQRSKVPASWRDRLTVIHDGIDTECVKPDAKAVVRLARADWL